ncbi:MAG: hypothetical protein IK062_08055, partial [Selenomonadaceae bacterium]|nr:hypothetical protein [Selenomonadaceae bacterium]
MTEITGEEINFGKADYLVDWNDPVTSTMTFDLTGLKKNTIFVTTRSNNNDYCNFVGTFINGELTCRYDTTKEIIKNLPEGETVKFKGLTYKRENGKIFVEKNNSIEIYSYEDDLDVLSLENTSEKFVKEISGITAEKISDFDADNNVVTLDKDLFVGKNISFAEGNFTLKLPEGTPSPQYYGASWSVSNGTIKYNSASNSAGYSLSGDKKSVTYTSATSSQNLLTITGLKNSATQNDFSVSGNVVTLKKSALDGKNISVTGNYTIAIANDVEIPTITKKAGWTVSKGTAKYFSESISGGYNLSSDKKSLTYTNKIDGKVLATVTGLKKSAKTSDFSLKNNIITLKKSALGKKNISVTGNYTLALAKNISKPKTTKAGWTISETNATYKNKKISAGYTLSKNKKSVSYTKESGGKTLVTLSGLKSGVKAKNLSLKKKTVTISKNAIGTDLISVKGDGYKFILKSSGNLKNIGKTANLQGSSENDTLIGGTGKDTLNGGKGDDILTGGKGKDIFIFSEGNDTITDYTAGQDKIKISSGKISKTTVNGKDVIFTIGKGSITVKNGKDKKITIENSSGKTSTKTYSKNISELWFAEENNFV